MALFVKIGAKFARLGDVRTLIIPV